MTARILQFPRHRIVNEPLLTKRQLGEQIGKSKRWIETMQKEEGLPFSRDRRGRCRYRLSEVLEFMDERVRAFKAAH